MPSACRGQFGVRTGVLVTYTERAVVFGCALETLVGVLTLPQRPLSRGVLVLVGGPQYRVGSHRQFTLLGRALASQGWPVFRFDYRGMGDGTGEARSFENVGEDVHAAVDCFLGQVPEVEEVVIWGLCDAASAALFYAHTDRRITGLALLNPWVRTPEGQARAYVRHYYAARLFQPEFWKSVISGRVSVKASVLSFVAIARAALRMSKPQEATNQDGGHSLPDRMLRSLTRFTGRVLLILSGDDLTAREFQDTVRASPRWQRALQTARVSRHGLPDANHTFAAHLWREEVEMVTCSWLGSW